MKKGTIQKIEKELDEKRKMPKELKEKVRTKIFTNAIIAICLILYFLFLFLGSANKTKGVRVIDLEVFSSIFLVTSITLFEIAYKRDSGTLAIYGIETLIVGIITLFLPYIIFELQPQYQIFYNLVGAYFGIYYTIKCICIAIKAKNDYGKNISDVKEIVKKEKRQIKDEDDEVKGKEPKQKETTKNNPKSENLLEEKKVEKKETNKPKQAKSTKTKKTKVTTATKEQVDVKNKTTKTNKTTKKQAETKTKKTSSSKTTTKPVTKKEETAESTAPKKRGRPKKQETIQKEENKEKAEEAKAENTPKKRGRPRKVVTQ